MSNTRGEFVSDSNMQLKCGLVFGVVNRFSIAWGIVRLLYAHGAKVIVVCQTHKIRNKVKELCCDEGMSDICVSDVDVEDEEAMDTFFTETIHTLCDRVDYVVHSIAYADRISLQGKYIDTTKSSFLRAMHISCFSFVDIVSRVQELLSDNASVITMTYIGSMTVVPNYNVMGVAKAALEASVRYIACDVGVRGIRVNAISAGPMRTLSGKAIGGALSIYEHSKEGSFLGSNPTQDDLGNTAVYLLSDMSRNVTGQVIFVDGGYSKVGISKVVF